MRYLTEHPPQTIEDTLAWIRPKIAQQEADGLSLWAIVDKASGNVIGDCGLQFEDEARTEIGLACRLRRSAWHRGYAQEASGACLRAGFEQLGVDRIVGITHELNITARRLMTRLGMRYLEQREWEGMPMVVYELSADR
jgi:RimJ/RimL family protein N-acetyltransferase